MKAVNKSILFVTLIATLMLAGCGKEGPQGPQGPAGKDATVYYSEWFSPVAWSGNAGDWYFAANAPDLTEDIVERGVVLAYAWLAYDLYNGTSVRPLPAYAVGANWDFLIHQYGSIEFNSDMLSMPATSGNKFRFIAIPGTIPALKSGGGRMSAEELRSLPYQEVCRIYNIPE